MSAPERKTVTVPERKKKKEKKHAWVLFEL